MFTKVKTNADIYFTPKSPFDLGHRDREEEQIGTNRKRFVFFYVYVWIPEKDKKQTKKVMPM